MRIHTFINTGVKPMPELIPNWTAYVCMHCGKVSGLDGWQIRDMPKDMAVCPNGRKLSIWERLQVWIASSIDGTEYNCLG